MRIDFSNITEFLPVFVPAIVTATLASCEAGALQRELTDSELNQIMNGVAAAVTEYMDKFAAKMRRQGTPLSKDKYNIILKEIQSSIYENAWALIQLVNEELKKRNEAI